MCRLGGSGLCSDRDSACVLWNVRSQVFGNVAKRMQSYFVLAREASCQPDFLKRLKTLTFALPVVYVRDCEHVLAKMPADTGLEMTAPSHPHQKQLATMKCTRVWGTLSCTIRVHAQKGVMGRQGILSHIEDTHTHTKAHTDKHSVDCGE